MRSGRYWIRFRRLFTVSARSSMFVVARYRRRRAPFLGGLHGKVPQAMLEVGPDALGGVQVRGVGGQADHGQPVGVGVDEGPHLHADLRVQVAQMRITGGVELVVCGGEEGRVLGLADASAFALAPRWITTR
jgi:hypothetical protein